MANSMKQTLSRVQTIVEREKQQRDGNFLFKKRKVLLYLRLYSLTSMHHFHPVGVSKPKVYLGKKFNFLTSKKFAYLAFCTA
jgi:hypothetical protein